MVNPLSFALTSALIRGKEWKRDMKNAWVGYHSNSTLVDFEIL